MPFAIPKIKTCGCGCSIRTGTKIIAYFYVVTCLTVIILSVVVGIVKGKLGFFGLLLEITFTAEIVFSSFLLYGVIKENYVFVLPWVLLHFIFLFFTVLNCIIYIFLHAFGVFLPQLTGEFIEMVIISYTILVVYNYYRQLKDEGTFPTRGGNVVNV